MSRAKVHDFILLSLRVVFLGLCMFTLFGGHYPPVVAQSSVMTVEDAVQDTNIKALNEHISSTDERLQKQWETMNKLSTDMAGIQGEERLIGILLGSGMSISIFLQVKKRSS